MTLLIIAENYLLSLQLTQRDFILRHVVFLSFLCHFSFSLRSLSVFSRRIFVAGNFAKMYFCRFLKNFFFLSAVSRPRQIEVSR